MPVLNASYTVAQGTRVKVASADNMPQEVILHEGNHNALTTVFLGNETVTGSNGFHFHPGETLSMTLGPNDELYAYSTQGNPVIQVIQIQKED